MYIYICTFWLADIYVCKNWACDRLYFLDDKWTVTSAIYMRARCLTNTVDDRVR